MTFGEYLGAAVEAAGFASNASFARAAGVTTGSVSKWRNDNETPSVEMLRRMAPVLEVDLLELVVRAEILSWQEAHLPAPLEQPKKQTFESKIADLDMSAEAREVVLREFERMERLREAGKRTARHGSGDADDTRRSA